jgi:hypothetical protein
MITLEGSLPHYDYIVCGFFFIIIIFNNGKSCFEVHIFAL